MKCLRRVIGIDTGTYCTGYGIIELLDNKIWYVSSGCIKSRSKNFFTRMQKIYSTLEHIIYFLHPSILVLEKIYYYKYPKSILRLGYLNGSIIQLAINNFLSVYEYNVSHIRKLLVSKGNVSKEYINKKVRQILKINSILSLDVTDALAAALAYVILHH